MTSDEQNALRAMLREEINAAVYASEQRLGERIDKLETTVASMGERLARVEFVQKQMTVNLVQVASVLDEATIKINDLQRSQVALENGLYSLTSLNYNEYTPNSNTVFIGWPTSIHVGRIGKSVEIRRSRATVTVTQPALSTASAS